MNSSAFYSVIMCKVFLDSKSQQHRNNMERRKPTRCYTTFYWTCNLLNIFRASLCPSSGDRDYTASMACGV